jgi:murein DD-endopeptidase MepM/ murein hydrolase activator NlpD
MRGYCRKKFAALFLAVLVILPLMPIFNVTAASQNTRDQLREAERRRAAAGQQVNEQANLLAGTEYEMSRVMLEMQAIDQAITDVQEALEIIEPDLLATELRIEEALEALELARYNMEVQTEILHGRLRLMHEQGNIGLLEVLFQAESISDFFNRWEHIRVMTQFDRELLANMEETELQISSNYDDLRRARVLIMDLRQQEVLAEQAIQHQMEERHQFFALLHEDAERQAEFLAIMEEEAHAINIEFNIVQNRYRAEVAEQERIRREAAEARRREEAAARAAEQANRLATLNSFESFAWPLAIQGQFSSPFGNRPSPFNSARQEFHTGIDIAAPANTRINAAEAGYVRLSGWSASWGNWIIIDHANGYSTMYAHNTRNRVTEGQRVTRGQHIADVGTTGMSTGNHLHFEVRVNGTHVDPMRYFGN